MSDIATSIKEIAAEESAVFLRDLAEPEIANEVSQRLAEQIERRLRALMSGDRGYISSQSPADRQATYERVRRMFNGCNATEIARELKIGRATVYRILKRPG